MMQVALMIPCYIDMFYPRGGIATLELLERLGVDVVYPKEQTCCGQPMANSGCYEEAQATEEHRAKVFSSFDCVVTPSGSCAHHIRNKFTAAADSPEKQNLVRNTYDLVEFLHDVLKVREFPWATFEHKVALHTSCSAIRGLNMASMSERVHDPVFSKPRALLSGLAETGSILLSDIELQVNTIAFLAHGLGPSGSADISGITVHPAQGVKTLTVILSPVTKASQRTG